MKRKISIYMVLLSTIAIVGCYDTDDNSKYGKKIEISIEGLKDLYTQKTFDVLNIAPEVSVLNTESDLEYQWLLFPAKYTEKAEAEVIGTDKDLHHEITQKPDNYTLILRVLNRKNGQLAQAKTSLLVENPMSRGFYVLKEIDNNTEIDLHDAQGALSENLMHSLTGHALQGSPVSMGVLCKYSFFNQKSAKYEYAKGFGICSESDCSIIDLNSISEIYNHSTMFYNTPSEESPLFLAYGIYGSGFFSDKGAYYTNMSQYSSKTGSGKFGYAKILDEKEYKVNSNIMFNFGFHLFDELNGRFFGMNYNGDLFSYSDLNGVQSVNLPNNIPYNMVYYGRNRVGISSNNNCTGFALMRDKAKSDLYLYKLDLVLNRFDNPINSVKKITNMKINNANLFAIDELQAKIIYFATNNELYYLDTETTSESKITLSDFGGEEIIFVCNKYWTQSDDEAFNFNYLVIGTYTAGSYKIYMYNTVGGIPNGTPKNILTGTGKPVQIQYMSPLMNDDSGTYGYYPCSKQ